MSKSIRPIFCFPEEFFKAHRSLFYFFTHQKFPQEPFSINIFKLLSPYLFIDLFIHLFKAIKAPNPCNYYPTWNEKYLVLKPFNLIHFKLNHPLCFKEYQHWL